jgi:hypothetical protein
LRLVVEVGRLFAISAEAHVPGPLDGLDSGCCRAEVASLDRGSIVRTRAASK